MEVIETKTRKWGNSIGIIIPKEIIKKSQIKPDKRIEILILNETSKTTFKSLFGTGKFSEKSTQKIKDSMRKELYGKSDIL